MKNHSFTKITGLIICLFSLQSAFSATEIPVKWNYGYVGSSTNTAGYKNEICQSGNLYSYTDVFTISKAGTKIYFTDDTPKFASSAGYVVSSWKKDAFGEWVIDLDGSNYPGSSYASSDIARANEINQVTYEYITSKDNENLRLCYRSDQKSATALTTYPNVYCEPTTEPGTAHIKQLLNEWIIKQKQEINFTQLEEKTIYALGDSFFAGNGLDPDYLWVSMLAQKYNMNFLNYGVNGSTVSDYVTTNNPMCIRYINMSSASPDIILLDGGRNDYNKSVPIGSIDSHDTKTFIGALNVTIEGLTHIAANKYVTAY